MSLQLQKVSYSSRVEKGKTPCWEWCDFPESQPKAITRQTPVVKAKVFHTAPKATFVMMIRVKVKGQSGNKFVPTSAPLTLPQEKKKDRLPEAAAHRRALSPDRLHPSCRFKIKINLRNCSQSRGGTFFI